MKFGIHNPSWVFGPDPTEAFEGVNVKAQWAENHGFVWFSVMDHLIQIGGVGAPHEPLLVGRTLLLGVAGVTHPIHLPTPPPAGGYPQPSHLGTIAPRLGLIRPGMATL